MNYPKFLTVLSLIALGLMSRLIPHPANFTSLNAIALLGTLCLGSCWLSFATLVSILFLSDLLLGFHNVMPFVYVSFGMIVFFGSFFKMTFKRMPFLSLGTSLLFFLVTNLGEWFSGSLYPKTLEGLVLCYTAAIPFLSGQIWGDLSYSLLLFALYKFTPQSSSTYDYVN